MDVYGDGCRVSGFAFQILLRDPDPRSSLPAWPKGRAVVLYWD
jgi:hypothetical protein